MVVCRNQPAFAQEMLVDLKSRQQNAVRVMGDQDYQIRPVLANSSASQVLLTLLALPLANLFDFLL